ncbi:hypothetical protein EI94DRAFT_1702910 [Lactarius quietus]|nr:hypothetical protein EI94DRAFT_1702910 [Lactarius quietus]
MALQPSKAGGSMAEGPVGCLILRHAKGLPYCRGSPQDPSIENSSAVLPLKLTVLLPVVTVHQVVYDPIWHAADRGPRTLGWGDMGSLVRFYDIAIEVWGFGAKSNWTWHWAEDDEGVSKLVTQLGAFPTSVYSGPGDEGMMSGFQKNSRDAQAGLAWVCQRTWHGQGHGSALAQLLVLVHSLLKGSLGHHYWLSLTARAARVVG